MNQKYNISKEFLPIIQIVKKAGEEILKIYKTDFKTQIKEDNTPLTKADILANDLIIKNIKENFKEDGIISEEIEDKIETYSKKRIWVIDPIDGTKGFIKKNGEFSIMIGLLENFKPIFGIVFKPIENELFFAQKDKGAYLEKDDKITKLNVSKVNQLKNVTVYGNRNHPLKKETYVYDKLQIKQFKKTGSIGIKICKLAQGKSDLYLNLSNHLGKWDICGPQIILEEAGGIVFDKFGDELNYKNLNERMINGVIGTNNSIPKKNILNTIKQVDN